MHRLARQSAAAAPQHDRGMGEPPLISDQPLRPLLVGELNPYGPDQRFALYPSPPGSAGDRLCRLILRLDPGEYLRRFERANLCTGRFSASEARHAAQQIRLGERWTVLLGRRVADAFRRAHAIPLEPMTVDDRPEVRLVVLPHPSGRNLYWNDPANFERCRELLRRAGLP